MKRKIRPAWIEVNTEKAIRNFNNIRNHVKSINSETKVCAVVKANSYGMGAVELSKLYVENGVDMLAVAMLTEALEIRHSIKDIDILILGYTPDEMFEDAIDNNIILTMYNYNQTKKLNDIAKKKGIKTKIHILIDTGMNRLGFLPTDESIKILESISKFDNIFIEGIYSHFANADELDKTFAQKQGNIFSDFCRKLEKIDINIPIKHIGNSATIIDLPEFYFDMVRAGIILSGFYPSSNVDKSVISIEPCLKLKAYISNVKTVLRGNSVSYGRTFIANKDMVVGTVPIGYADGFDRSLSNNFYVIVNNSKCLLLGRVCMDQFMIDLTNIKNPNIGDEIIIYGDGSDNALTIEDVAKIRNTISYEVESTLSNRLPRIYI